MTEKNKTAADRAEDAEIARQKQAKDAEDLALAQLRHKAAGSPGDAKPAEPETPVNLKVPNAMGL